MHFEIIINKYAIKKPQHYIVAKINLDVLLKLYVSKILLHHFELLA